MKISSNNSPFKILGSSTGITREDKNKEVLKDALTAIRETREANSLMKSEERSGYKEKIYRKISMGARLTPREMAYLQKTDPAMYMKVKRIEMHREALENRLKSCRSKQEVEEVYSQAFSMIREKDPDGQLLAKAFSDVLKEFKKTKEYNSLPAEGKDDIRSEALKQRK